MQLLYARSPGSADCSVACSGSLQAAVDAIVASIRAAGEEFEAYAAEIREMVRRMKDDEADDARLATEEGLSDEMERVIQACKDFCVGNIAWSLVTERYGMGEMRRLDDGGIELVI